MSCNRYLRLFCYHNEEVENRDCCGDTKTGHKYLNGVAIFSGSKLLAMLERPFNVSDLGELVTIKDVNELEYTFRASQTKYSHEQLIEFLNNCNSFFESEWGNIEGDIEDQQDLWIELQKRNNICNVRHFGEGEELPDTLVDCVLYIKDGKYYVNDGSGDPLDVTPESGVLTVTGSDGIEVDDTDPQNPIAKLTQASKDSLQKADSAVQPGDLADVATSGDFGDLQNVPDFIEESERDQPGGFAGVGMDGFIPSLLLPSYVDDVLEFADFASLPPTGESGKIYVTIDDNKTYRWSGSAYVEISSSLALGETSSTAYRGDRGKIAYDHSQVTSGNPHNVTASEVGLGNVDNTSDADKPVSTAQGQAINQAEVDAKQYTDDEITALNLGTASQADTGDFATAAQGAKADTALQPLDNMSELTDDTTFLTDVIEGANVTIDKTNPKEPIISGLSAAIPEYSSKGAAIADVNLGQNYPFSVEGDDTAYVKKDTGFVSTWDTTQSGVSNSDEILLPLRAGGVYNFDVYYQGQVIKSVTTDSDKLVTFPDGGGVKQIAIIGQFEEIQAYQNDPAKLISIDLVSNDFKITSGNQAFLECTNLVSVGNIDVSSVTIMYQMFYQASSFNQDISGWDVSSVTNMISMFRIASAFNQDIGGWDVSSVTNMSYMFFQSTTFEGLNIQNWNVENVTNFSNFATGVTIPTATYDQILTNWAAQNVQPSLSINFGNSKYSPAGLAGRNDLINNHLWTITDGGAV